MNAKHTPGPWTMFISDSGSQWTGWPLSINNNDLDRAVVRPGGFFPYEWDRGVSQDEAVANARLIAAAPEMLEALREALDNSHGLDRGAFEMITAAIARATGGES